ncbi:MULTISPECIES: hypothetical protein [Streptomyces]|uniref:hypothetical protein n=1 Tax=Streptomyces TaxID=1883 RepID=UPI000B197F47|nr:hypothetical protein [Streptomyces sp. NRRL S-1896]
MRPHQPRTLEEALDRARIREGTYTRAHREASRRRIADQLSELHGMKALTGPVPGQRTPYQPLMLHERAGHDLRALCQGVIHDDEAARRIARFDASSRIEVAGRQLPLRRRFASSSARRCTRCRCRPPSGAAAADGSTPGGWPSPWRTARGRRLG